MLFSKGQDLYFCAYISKYSTPLIAKVIIYPLNYSGIFLENQLTICICASISGLSILFFLLLMCVTSLTQFGLIFHVLLLLCSLFHLMKPTLVFIYTQSFLSAIKRKKINVGTETVHREASLGTY